MPDEAGYRVWREAVELSVVSNSGRHTEAKCFVEEIAQFDPVYLARNCPHDMNEELGFEDSLQRSLDHERDCGRPHCN